MIGWCWILSYKKQRVEFEDLSPEDREIHLSQKREALLQSHRDLVATLNDYVSVAKESEDPEELKLAASYLSWLLNKTDKIREEKTFVVDSEKMPRRGEVFWMDFGFNVGREFGGRHPAVILKCSGGMVIVLPLSTQEPYPDQLKSGIYVEVDYVRNFKKCRRWVNVLNVVPLSIQRVDFSSNSGHINGYVLDRINESLTKSLIGGRKKKPNSPTKTKSPSKKEGEKATEK